MRRTTAADRSVVALGMFDGVHIGHQVLLKKGRALADRQGVPLVACTFMDHPLQLIAPDKCPPMLTTFDERVRLMESLGVDVFYAMPFDRSVMDMPPEDYVGHLVRQFHPTDVVCGYNPTFGKKGGGRQGDVARARAVLGRPSLRQAAVAARRGGRWELFMTPNGKQDVPRGNYRALCSDGEHTWPVLLRVEREGRALCSLPAGTTLHDELEIHFLTSLSVDS